MDHFEGCQTVADVKGLYKTLCFTHHPDVSGYDSTAVMQEINAEYLRYLEGMNGQVSKGFDGRDHTYKYDYAREVGAMDTIDQLIKAKFSDAVSIELLGSWVWVSGIVYKSEDQGKLQAIKHPERKKKNGEAACLLSWHSKRKRYYWRPDGAQTFYNGRASFDDLRSAFGSMRFENGNDEERKRAKQPAMMGA